MSTVRDLNDLVSRYIKKSNEYRDEVNKMLKSGELVYHPKHCGVFALRISGDKYRCKMCYGTFEVSKFWRGGQ